MYGPLVVYAYGVFNLEKVKVMSMTDLPKNITQVLNQVIMGALMLMIFGILVVALTVMLLYRAIMLWMYMVFSPLFTLHFVAGKDLLWGKLESFDIQQFIWLCFMPAVVGLVLSFGLVIVSTIQSTWTNNPNVETCDGAKIRSDAGCTIDSALKITRKVVADPEGSNNYITVSEMEISTLTVEFKWKLNVTQNIDEMAQGVNSTRNALDSAGGIFGTLILDIIAIVFIWMAFMAAKWMNKIIWAVLDPFENFGKEIWKLGTSLPKYAPLPIPGGNIAGATKIAGMWQSALDYRSQQKLDQDPLYKYLKEKAWQGGVTAERTAWDKTKFEKWNINDIKSTAQSYSAAESDALIDKVVKTTSDAARGNIIRQLSWQEKEKATELWKKVSDNNATPTEKLQLHAILAWQRWADISSKSEAALKELIDSIKKSTNNWSAQSSTENKVKLQWSKMDISINNTNIIANADSTKTAEQIATAIKAADWSTNYKNHVSKDEFISVMTTWLWGTDAAKTKATEIADKLWDNFFKTEAKTDTEATKPAEPTEPKK